MNHIPFFVSGVPKSGTTWLGRLMDAHPEISCKGEACMHAFTKSLIKISNEYNQLLNGRTEAFSDSNEFPPLTDADVHAMARYFFELRLKTAADPAKDGLRFVGEKDPYHVVNFPFLAKVFPEAKIFHIVRDGRSVVVSAWHHNLRIASQGIQTTGFDKFMDEAAGQWGSMHRRAMETKALLGDRYLEVRYEDLIADPLPQLTRVIAHLGAETRAETLQHCLDAASFANLSKGRSQGQEDPTSFFRKGIADDWKNEMTPAQIQRFNARSGGMLKELGYEG